MTHPVDALQDLRRCVREGRYILTIHAVQEAADDDLHLVDMESAILTGSIVREEPDPARGVKYVVEGFAADLSTRVGVASRFLPDRSALIITVYEIGD